MPVDVCVRRWALSTPTRPEERVPPRSVITTRPLPSTASRLCVADCRNSKTPFTCLPPWAETESGHPVRRTASRTRVRTELISSPAYLVPPREQKCAGWACDDEMSSVLTLVLLTVLL